MAYGYGEDEDLSPLNHSTVDKGRYKILNGEYNEESLSYPKMKLHRIKEPMSEECLNNIMMSKKEQMRLSDEGSMSNGTPDVAEQLFTCKVCDRKFISKNLRQNHEDTHTEVNPFECKECHRGFTRKHYLKKHMRLHIGEKPYHCNKSQDIASKCNNNNNSFEDTSFQITNCKLRNNIIQAEAKESDGNTSEGSITESGSESNNQIKSLDKIKSCVTSNDMKRLENCSYSQNNGFNKNKDNSKCNKTADPEKIYAKSSKNDLPENYDHDLPDLPKSISKTSLQNNSKIKNKDKQKSSCNLDHRKICNTFVLHNKFICKICKNTFRTKELLNEHIDIHRAKTYDCSKCGQQFRKLFEVAIHLHMHAHREKWENPKTISENKSDKSANKRKSVAFNDEVNVKYINGVSDFNNTFEQTKTSHSKMEMLHSNFNNKEMNSLPVSQTDESSKIIKLETENNSLNKTNDVTEVILIKKERGKFECGWCNFTCDVYKSLLLHRHTHSQEYQCKVISDLKKSGDTDSDLIVKAKHKKNKSSTTKTNKDNHEVHELGEKSNSNKRKFETESKSCQESSKHKACKLDNNYPSNHDISNNNNTMINNGHILKYLAESELKDLQSIENDTELLQNHTKGVPSAEKVNKRVNKKGETNLIRACMLNKEKEVRQLLSVPGININQTDYAGWTALHEAAIKGNTEIVKLLLDFQPRAPGGTCVTDGYCDVTIKGTQGMTALHDSVAEGNIDIVKLILEYGGNTLLKMKNSSGKLARDMTTDADILNLIESFEGTKGKHLET